MDNNIYLTLDEMRKLAGLATLKASEMNERADSINPDRKLHEHYKHRANFYNALANKLYTTANKIADNNK